MDAHHPPHQSNHTHTPTHTHLHTHTDTHLHPPTHTHTHTHTLHPKSNSIKIKIFVHCQEITHCIFFVLYCIVSINLYSIFCSAHQPEALPVRETQREESSLERTKRRTWHTS